MYHSMDEGWGMGWGWLWMTLTLLLWLVVLGGLVYAIVRMALRHEGKPPLPR